MGNPARLEELKTYVSDDFIQIKRFKFRGKFELFVHNRDFKTLLTTLNLELPGEEDKPAFPFKKKIVFYHLNYGIMLQAYFQHIAENIDRWTATHSKKQLTVLENNIHKLQKDLAHLFESDEDFDWGVLYQKVVEQIKSWNKI